MKRLTKMGDPPPTLAKMNVQEFQIFLQRWKRGEFKGYRFGQAFMKALDATNAGMSRLTRVGPWDDYSKVEERLYFTTDKSEANRLILKEFIDYGD